jgi:pectin methylesterase-like acyl-CoA thioesterase
MTTLLKPLIRPSLGFAVAFLLTTLAIAAPAKPVVTVALDGKADYHSLQAAINAAPVQGEVIRVKPGTYYEVLNISQNGIEIRGLGKNPAAVVISASQSAASTGDTGKSGTVTITGDDFYAENLTIENTWTRTNALSKQGSQAVALRAQGDREIFRNVRLLGYQDTLYADSKTCHDLTQTGLCHAARQYYADSYIEGHVDFIFGDAKAVFDRCELHSLAHPTSYLTAQSKKYAAEDSGYVFWHAKLTAESGADRVFLGRPWRAYATVIFLESELGAQIDPAGWQDWQHDGKSSLTTMYYAEYKSHGPGANPKARIAESHQLTDAEAKQYETTKYLAGTDGWNPTLIH